MHVCGWRGLWHGTVFNNPGKEVKWTFILTAELPFISRFYNIWHIIGCLQVSISFICKLEIITISKFIDVTKEIACIKALHKMISPWKVTIILICIIIIGIQVIEWLSHDHSKSQWGAWTRSQCPPSQEFTFHGTSILLHHIWTEYGFAPLYILAAAAGHSVCVSDLRPCLLFPFSLLGSHITDFDYSYENSCFRNFQDSWFLCPLILFVRQPLQAAKFRAVLCLLSTLHFISIVPCRIGKT